MSKPVLFGIVLYHNVFLNILVKDIWQDCIWYAYKIHMGWNGLVHLHSPAGFSKECCPCPGVPALPAELVFHGECVRSCFDIEILL